MYCIVVTAYDIVPTISDFVNDFVTYYGLGLGQSAAAV